MPVAAGAPGLPGRVCTPGLGLCAHAHPHPSRILHLRLDLVSCAQVHPGFGPSSFRGLPQIAPTASCSLRVRAILVNA